MTAETRELRARWQDHRQALLRADYNHADEELARALYYADHSPIIAGILQRLRSIPQYQEFDAELWLDSRITGPANLGFSLDDASRTSQCLKVLELAVRRFAEGQQGLISIGRTTYGGASRKYIDHIRSAIEAIFEPFYRHVDAELRAHETLITPTDIMNQIQSLVDSDTTARYPQTHKLLVDAYRQLFTLSATSSGASWYQVGYSCRQTLVRFADEVFDSSYVPQGQDQPKQDDARSKLKWTVRHHLRQAGVGERYRGSIEAIVKANWDFVSAVGHRQESVTEEDARLAVIYTYLTISAVDCVLTRACQDG
jgi:hypothetical protein